MGCGQSSQKGSGQSSQMGSGQSFQKGSGQSSLMGSGQSSQASAHIAKSPRWYLDHALDLYMEAVQQLRSGSDPNKAIVFPRQCEYLVKHLGTAIDIGRKSWERSSSHEHGVECGGALELLCRLAKEVTIFVWDCCNMRWMQAALTLAIVPDHVSSWRWRLKVCGELLDNSNKLGGAWLTIGEHGGGGEVGLPKTEQLEIQDMDLEDECDLRELLESMLDQSNRSNSMALILNVELVSIILKRLEAREAMQTMIPSESSSWKDLYKMAWKVELEDLHNKWKEIDRRSLVEVFKGEWFGFEVASRVHYYSVSDQNMEYTWLSHPNIVSHLGFGYKTSDEPEYNARFEIMELMDGDLRTLMEQRMQRDGNLEGPFGISEACDLMLQVAEGVWYMHQNRVVFRDLKPSKILVRRFKDDTLEYICLKICDFDRSNTIGKCITNSVQTLDVGTTRYRAPELFRFVPTKSLKTYEGMSKHPFKLDVYSFGVTCFEILTGEHPYASLGVQEIKRKVFEGLRPTLPQRTPQSLRNLIKLCWDPNPMHRPSFAEICKELWYIKCSLLVEPQDHTAQLPLPVLEPLELPPQLENMKVQYPSLAVKRKLGSGGSDMVTVFLSTWLKSEVESEVAQKHFMGSHNECFKNEVSIMVELKHPNVVSLLGYASDRRSCSIVMELMDGDLQGLMHERRLEGKVTPTGPFPMADALHVILQIAQGMQYVHREYVAHRDLKSCNILITNPSGGGKLVVKVADFGLSVKLRRGNTLLSKGESGVGTPRWMAPEVIGVPASGSSLRYDSFKSDVFSFGMLCYEILVGEVPFAGVDQDTVQKYVLDGERPSLPEWTPSYLKVLIEKCWVKKASKRPSFKDIVRELTKVRFSRNCRCYR